MAALLFAIEATVKVRDSKTVTEEKAYCLLPGGVKGVTYNEVSAIDFTSAKTKKKLLVISISSPQTPTVRRDMTCDIHIEIITLNSDFWEEICTKLSYLSSSMAAAVVLIVVVESS